MRHLNPNDLKHIRGAAKGIVKSLYPPTNSGAVASSRGSHVLPLLENLGVSWPRTSLTMQQRAKRSELPMNVS